jgi:hypothetical protein
MNMQIKGLSLMFWLAVQLAPTQGAAQGVPPYPNSITDRTVRGETPMTPPPVRTVFKDPDFGSSMVRVTDANTNPQQPGSYFRNSASVDNEWSLDSRKFFVTGKGSVLLAFGFDPATMTISSLPGAGGGGGLRLPIVRDAAFSNLDPDLIFGMTGTAPLTLNSYRFSTRTLSLVGDLTTCGTQPPLVVGKLVTTSDLSNSVDDNRLVVSAGGNQFGNRILVVVYDRKLGCRWYNTQTGQIGGQWGQSGTSPIPSFLIRHSSLSGNGQYVKISVDRLGFLIWDLATLNVTACPNGGPRKCGGYGAMGFSTYVNPAGAVDELNLLRRPLSNLVNLTQLQNPLPLPYYLGMELHPTWSNGRFNDNAPICGSTYSASGDTRITQPYDGEIFCMETDGVASTVWRFGHNRATWDPEYFWSEPFGNVSSDGHFFLFSSGWDGQVGVSADGSPRSDVWIVKLD